MKVLNKFSEDVWKKEEEKFRELQRKVKIPNRKLDKVDVVIPKKESDFDKIPDVGGCYWIWTNEPVKHRFHRNRAPEPFDGGEIIYNGIAKDNVSQRARHHLLGEIDAGWSGISLDIYPGEARSHKKKALSRSGKVPYVDCIESKSKRGMYYECKPVRDKKLLLKLHLSSKEKAFIKNSGLYVYYFRNGINIFEKKHKNFTYRVYFIIGMESLYLEFLEKRWREKFGLPKMCSYSSGR